MKMNDLTYRLDTEKRRDEETATQASQEIRNVIKDIKLLEKEIRNYKLKHRWLP